MSQLIKKESENNLVLIDLLNRNLREDIQAVLKSIQLEKRNMPNLEKYEMKKKFLLQKLKDNNDQLEKEVKLNKYITLFFEIFILLIFFLSNILLE